MQQRMFVRATPEEMKTIASDPRARALFAASGLSTVDDIVAKATKVQDLALQGDAKRPYVCVLRGAFLVPRISDHPCYAQVVAKEGLERRRILDIGCCMGTDLRQLLVDGARKELTSGIDYSSDFIRLGFELFGDRDTMQGVFHRVDLLENLTKDMLGGAEPTGWLAEHAGAFDVAHCGAVLHTFESKEEVREVLRRALLLLTPGGMLFGSNRPVWVHDAESLRAELESVGFERVEVVATSRSGGEVASTLWRPSMEGFAPEQLRRIGRGTFFTAYKPRA